MAAFSLGKLDAICARLKSSQQSSLATSGRRDNDRAHDVKEEAQASFCEVRKCVVAAQDEHQEAEQVVHSRDKLQLGSLQPASQDGCKGLEVFEKIKVQSAASTGVKLGLSDDSIIDKDNSTNNNSAEATDYNNEIDISFQSTTFQTADSTTTNADSCVSSTTAEPSLCNENITKSIIGHSAASSAELQPSSGTVSSVKTEMGSLLRAHPEPSLSSAAALFSPPDSVSEEGYSGQHLKKSSSDPSNAGHIGIKCVAGQAAATDWQVSSAVTSTQGCIEEGKGGNTQKLQPSIKTDRGLLLLPTSLGTVSPKTLLFSPTLLPFSPIHSESHIGRDTQSETSVVSQIKRNLLSNGEMKKLDLNNGEYKKPDLNNGEYKKLDLNNGEYKKPDLNNGQVLLTAEKEGLGKPQALSRGAGISSALLPVLDIERQVLPTLEGSSSQSSRSSASQELSGRRKSRKSTKPQRQVTNKSYVDPLTEGETPFENPDFVSVKEQNDALKASSSLLEKHLGGLVSTKTSTHGSQKENPVSEHYKVSHIPASALDLSANSSNKSLTPPLNSESSLKTTHLCNTGSEPAGCEPPQIDMKPNLKDKPPHEHPNALKRMSTSEEYASSISPNLEASDSGVLVDFANNTMKELLGIYGFDGQDARNVSPGGHLQNFQSDNLGHLTAAGDSKSSVLSLLKGKQAERQPLKKSKSKFVKSGVFRKNVYTSLAQHASTSYNSSASNSSSDTQETLNFADTSQGAAARTVKYAFSKKSYTQKVLNSSDFTKYIKRYGTGVDCGGKVCLDLGYRDHYHCLDCPQKVFIRKEETVRHYKWHKKRNDSLRHGFMRYSPLDDCSKKYGNCTHNGRQTHYHCVQGDCDKVYVSTSDVQMHANFHRKDSAIIQEGFQRFRATEDCGTTSCSFHGQRTTHFHCRRPQCNFTFKNKADMEKHKSYHQKDEVLSRDGFKKFMKYETCSFSGCRYSKISNHIHCIRPGCQYVLHSTAQLYSHKRKHERREFDHTYRTFRNLQQKVPGSGSIKTEEQNGQKPPSLSHALINQTKILPLPAADVASVKMVGKMSRPPAGNDKKQSLQTGTSTSLSLISNAIRKPVLDLNFPLPGSLLLTGKTLPHFSPARVATGEVLNLTARGEEGQKDKEELRQTLTLPVKLSRETFRSSPVGVKNELKSEVNGERYVKQEPKCEVAGEAQTRILEFTDEPQDLSLPKKEKGSPFFKDDSIKVDTSFKSEPDSDSLPQMSETFDGDYDDDEDDDDDDDDDDKDYGQVEEPTLVNTFSIALDRDKFNDSLNLTVPKQDGKQSRETVVSESVGLGTAVGRLMTPGANAGVPKVVAAVSESDKKGVSHGSPQGQRPQLLKQDPQGAPRAILTAKGKVLGVHIPVRLLPERRERDESWKRYLIRYTANDACFSRCSCLYKDHYHCRTEGCQVVFKSKDGVRGHARFHELQDSITPLVYLHFKPDATCSTSECPYMGKEEHFHCNWTNCSQIIPASAPTFSRLEHYRIHEYATVAANKSRTSFSTTGSKVDMDPLHKRRGRPPKYPKYDLPVVPKVHLTEKEILDSTLAFMHNKCGEDSKIFNGFKKCVASDPCPDDQCIYKGKEHFHCGRKYCHMSTDRLDVLNLHAKDFHNNITILDGYEFFERTVNCRRPVCHNNKINRHFHCMRPHCDYSFVRHSTMSQHNKKHPTVTSAVLSVPVTKTAPPPSTKVVPSQFVPIAPAVSQLASTPSTPTITSPNCSKTVKSAGTFFPLSGMSSFKMSSLSSPSISSGQVLTSGTTGPLLSTTPLTLGGATPTQILTGAQVFHAQDGTAIFSPGTLLTLPHNLISTSIPLLASSAHHSQQANLLAGLIPMGQMSQHCLATPLVSISSAQLIAASQGHVLHSSGGILGGGVFQVIHSPTTITSLTTSAPAPISTSSASSSGAATNLSSAPPLTVLLHQQQQQQQQQQLQDGVAGALNWASLKRRMHYSVDLNCGRPFCKLKKKDHYHCLDCNQAFSFSARLRAHISKHGFKFKKPEHKAKQSISPEFLDQKQAVAKPIDLSLETGVSTNRIKSKEVYAVKNEELSSSLNLQPSVFTSMVKRADVAETDVCYMNGNANRVVTKLFSSSDPKPSNANRVVTKLFSSSDPKPLNANKVVTKLFSISDSKPSACHQETAASDVDDNDSEDVGTGHVSESKHDDRSLDSPSLVIDDGLDDSYESSLDASSSSLTLCLSLSRKSGRKRVASKNEDFVCTNNLLIPKPSKKRKLQWGVRSESDLPEGFKRVRCGEDCGHVRCAYRQTVTHFHCVRADCGYGFSDKSRIVQHRIRHERLDALMGGEFQQYRASVTCDRADCEFDEKASHFHCLKCPYSCADSSKVPAHRKYHTKLDNISSNGFIKYAGSADCQIAACSYFRKQTHYHCTFPGCGHSVLGPSQMAPHKLKHA